MINFENMDQAQLVNTLAELTEKYKEYAAMGLALDMSRGKPGGGQLCTSDPMLDVLRSDSDMNTENGFDARNYGLFDGIPECKRLFADILETTPDNVIVLGNSSLSIMFDFVSQCMTHGAGGEPWISQGKIKFACPVPGYDRHFSILEYFGIEMVNVPMNSGGPDMDMLEELVKDPSVKGMICVPKYSNPTGITFSDDAVRRIAAMKPAAKDFRIIWDNAYVLHDLGEESDRLLEILSECEKNGSGDMVFEVASSSKMTYPGAGVAALASSKNNLDFIRKRLFVQTIGHDKVNQLRHARFFGGIDGLKAHMKLQAEHLAPRFQIVFDKLRESFGENGIASWFEPRGGYFVNLEVPENCAKRAISLCKAAGVTLTGVGAAFPYGKDPGDSNIRIAPTYPKTDELSAAMDVLCLCVKIAYIEKNSKQKLLP
ncbi:MAG: aminotransferase class I/II-fold pyridoxal phosphate-dependent enzyme [Oscillospiraceae bacterium]|nr:aminotransferase class I/II-fold pyridoxal phosphate-dependent enzyme [Oscillospiraceae bacterium]